MTVEEMVQDVTDYMNMLYHPYGHGHQYKVRDAVINKLRAAEKLATLVEQIAVGYGAEDKEMREAVTSYRNAGKEQE